MNISDLAEFFMDGLAGEFSREFIEGCFERSHKPDHLAKTILHELRSLGQDVQREVRVLERLDDKWDKFLDFMRDSDCESPDNYLSNIASIHDLNESYANRIRSANKVKISEFDEKAKEIAGGVSSEFDLRHNLGLIPKTVEQYTIVSSENDESMEGGFGIVRKARGKGGPYAIKFAIDNKSVDRLYVESRVLEHLKGRDFIPEFIDRNFSADVPYFVMKYVQGDTMSVSKLDPFLLRHVSLKLSEIVSELHGRGVVHRDVKPSNIIVRGLNPYLVDFGSVKNLGIDISRRISECLKSGEKLGTYGFMDPRIFKEGFDGDFQSDIYSLGATLYAFATGNILDPHNEVTVDIEDKRLQKIIQKCVRHKASKRYASVDRMIKDLNKRENVGRTRKLLTTLTGAVIASGLSLALTCKAEYVSGANIGPEIIPPVSSELVDENDELRRVIVDQGRQIRDVHQELEQTQTSRADWQERAREALAESERYNSANANLSENLRQVREEQDTLSNRYSALQQQHREQQLQYETQLDELSQQNSDLSESMVVHEALISDLESRLANAPTEEEQDRLESALSQTRNSYARATSALATRQLQIEALQERISELQDDIDESREGRRVLEEKGVCVTNLSYHEASDTHPQISADGQRVYFTSNRRGKSDIFCYDRESGDITNVTNTPGVSEMLIKVSPCLNELVYARRLDDVSIRTAHGPIEFHPSTFHLLNLITGRTSDVFSGEDLPENSYISDGSFVCSSDWRTMAFVRSIHGEGESNHHKICVFDRASGSYELHLPTERNNPLYRLHEISDDHQALLMHTASTLASDESSIFRLNFDSDVVDHIHYPMPQNDSSRHHIQSFVPPYILFARSEVSGESYSSSALIANIRDNTYVDLEDSALIGEPLAMSDNGRFVLLRRIHNIPAYSGNRTIVGVEGRITQHEPFALVNSTSSLYLLSARTGSTMKLADCNPTSGPRNDQTHAHFSPDGTHLVFSADTDGDYDIYKVSIDPDLFESSQ